VQFFRMMCRSQNANIQQLSPESSLVEIARRSNPVVLLEKMDLDRCASISVDFICIFNV